VAAAATGDATATLVGRNTRLAVLVLACIAAIGLSTFRIVIAPGFELYLAPIFYLLAYRIWGLRVGLLAAAMLMIPSYFWWGHAFSIAMAIAEVAFVHWQRRRLPLLSEAMIVFLTTIGAVAGFVFLNWNYTAVPTVATLIVFRKVINDGLCAAIVDVAMLVYRFDLATVTIRRPQPVGLAVYVRGFANAFILLVSVAVYAAGARQFDPLFAARSDALSSQATALLADDANSRAQIATQGVVSFAMPVGGSSSSRIFLSDDRASLLRNQDLRAALGCDKIDSLAAFTGPNDKRTFQYWMSTCTVHSIRANGVVYTYLASFRPLALVVYENILNDLFILMLIGIGASVALHGLNRVFERSVGVWTEVVSHFGTPDVAKPGTLPFIEFEGPVRQFVAANNDYVGLIRENQQNQKAITELKQSIDLRLVVDIQIDTTRGEVTFTELDLLAGPTPMSVPVHPADLPVILAGLDDREPLVEFRIAGRSTTEWYMLLAKDRIQPGHFQSGVFCRLRQPRTAITLMLHQSRLIEIGGMASAISHEMKQPLFTIALAAENGATYLQALDDDKARKAASKFEKIVAQVHRARDIIDRISRYARIESGDAASFDLAEAVTTSAELLQPMYAKADVDLSFASESDLPIRVTMPRVGFEQVIVNGLQNALDAVVLRVKTAGGARGQVDVKISRTGTGGVRVSITDNGTGLAPNMGATVFDPFFTTKSAGEGTGLGLYICRQILAEIGGQVSLSSAPDGGAVLAAEFPADVVDG
jgi:two-component system, NtrC family, C4-dicarboxylate transport sensor histidine kinase DctB